MDILVEVEYKPVLKRIFASRQILLHQWSISGDHEGNNTSFLVTYREVRMNVISINFSGVLPDFLTYSHLSIYIVCL